jgi:hypothetical protein
MLNFELREIENGFALTGGQLETPLLYREKDPDAAFQMVGFLSQQHGSELHVYGSDGALKLTQRREPAMPLEKGSMGDGLRGNLALGN